MAPWKKGWAQIKQKFVAFHTQVPAPSTSSYQPESEKKDFETMRNLYQIQILRFFILYISRNDARRWKKVSLIDTHIEWVKKVTDPPRQIDIRTNVPNELSTHFPSFFRPAGPLFDGVCLFFDG